MVSSVKLREVLAPVLPAASVAAALTVIRPSPKVNRSAASSTTASAVPPAPVSVLVTVPPPLRLKVTTVLAPLSLVSVITPPGCVASALVAPLFTPLPKVNTGADGERVSRSKLLVPAPLALPTLSVATALTLMVPSPKVARSAGSRVTATGVVPLPSTVLVTVLAALLKVTSTVAPASATTVTTPETSVASTLVAPPLTPVPRAKVGDKGGSKSTKDWIELAVLVTAAPLTVLLSTTSTM